MKMGVLNFGGCKLDGSCLIGGNPDYSEKKSKKLTFSDATLGRLT